jgi:hypothetical protein
MAATHQGTCPICRLVHKIVRGKMARHGFRRPYGHRQIIGRCWGTGHSPWELPEGKAAAQLYIDTVLTSAIARWQAFAQRIEAGTETVLYFQSLRHRGSVKVTAEGVEVISDEPVQPETDAAASKAASDNWSLGLQFQDHTPEWRAMSTWDRARTLKVKGARFEAEQIEIEAKHLMNRILDWKPGVLVEVSDAAPALPLKVKDGEVMIVREVRRGTHGQHRYEAWNGKFWTRATLAVLKPLLDAGKARWLNRGEKVSAA